MSSLWLTALLAGAALGVGVGVLLYVTVAPARPALAPLMKRAGSRPAPVITVTAPAPVPRNGWSRLAAARLSRWVDVEWLNSPDADLAVIEKIPPAVPARSGWAWQRSGCWWCRSGG